MALNSVIQTYQNLTNNIEVCNPSLFNILLAVLKNNFENQNFTIFEDVVDDFGRSDDYMIKWKNDEFPNHTHKNLEPYLIDFN